MMKTTISLPNEIFEEAEALAKQLGLSHSELYTKALQAYLQKYNRHQTLNKLNELYSQESSELDLFLARMQFVSIESNDW
jgi:metal-responsive CopG/Arc/MetJ family transcriptional regulator